MLWGWGGWGVDSAVLGQRQKLQSVSAWLYKNLYLTVSMPGAV